ncbi:MAG: signal peptidase I [Vicinamibacteria bacterium]|nr:signal peptidase I [Vicinamibacteria bacterium]
MSTTPAPEAPPLVVVDESPLSTPALPAADETALAPPTAADSAQAPPGRVRALFELLHDLSVAVLFCFFLITYVGQAFRVQGASMQPLLHDDERILVNKFGYRFGPIQRGDVVVFWYPRDPSVSFIKRVVGLPGDVVELRRGLVHVNGRKLEEPWIAAEFRGHDSVGPVEVERGHYFVLGDHRTSSNDSRAWGDVPERYIYGKAVFRFWPLGRIGRVE